MCDNNTKNLGEITCSDPFCHCHNDRYKTACCTDCKILPTIRVTIGFAFPDHTWVEDFIEFQIDPLLVEGHFSSDLGVVAFSHWLIQTNRDIKNLGISGWFILFWEWKN